MTDVVSITNDAAGNQIIHYDDGTVEVTRASDGEVVVFDSQPKDVEQKRINRFLNIFAPIAQLHQEASDVIGAIRDRRIDGGFDYNGYRFQSRPSDRENIMGAAQAAFMAISQGAPAGYLGWASGGQSDFGWITANNEIVPMDAFQTVALFQRGVTFKSMQTFYARGLKDAVLAMTDPVAIEAFLATADANWPE